MVMNTFLRKRPEYIIVETVLGQAFQKELNDNRFSAARMVLSWVKREVDDSGIYRIRSEDEVRLLLEAIKEIDINAHTIVMTCITRK
jgi:hypothetical protein